MRVCQPSPDARKDSTTSRERRMETSSLVGAFWGPRTPSLRSRDAGSASRAGRAFLKSASVHSGFSASTLSGVAFRLLIESLLSLVHLAETDHPDAALGFRENQGVKPLFQEPDGSIAGLTIVFPVVHDDPGRCKFKFRRPLEGQPAKFNVLG